MRVPTQHPAGLGVTVVRWLRRAAQVPTPAPGDPRHPHHPGWPEATGSVQLLDGAYVRLRPVTVGDFRQWRSLRLADEALIRPVEPTVRQSWAAAHTRGRFVESLASWRALAAEGQAIAFAIECDGEFVGQLTLGAIEHGTSSTCWVGYWVSSTVTGRGIAQAAVALGVDHAFTRVGLHRVTATYLPSNPASGRVLARVGFVREGLLRRNLHIDGRWQDHVAMALLADDVPQGAVLRLRGEGKIR